MSTSPLFSVNFLDHPLFSYTLSTCLLLLAIIEHNNERICQRMSYYFVITSGDFDRTKSSLANSRAAKASHQRHSTIDFACASSRSVFMQQDAISYCIKKQQHYLTQNSIAVLICIFLFVCYLRGFFKKSGILISTGCTVLSTGRGLDIPPIEALLPTGVVPV